MSEIIEEMGISMQHRPNAQDGDGDEEIQISLKPRIGRQKTVIPPTGSIQLICTTIEYIVQALEELISSMGTGHNPQLLLYNQFPCKKDGDFGYTTRDNL